MKQTGPIEAEEVQIQRSEMKLVLAGGLVVFAAYASALGVARNLSLTEAAMAGLANMLPTMLCALAAHRIVRTWLVPRGSAVQVFGHVLLGAIYAMITYWLQIVMLGAVYGASLVQFAVEPFPSRASAWQLLQNLTTYGIAAALAYLPLQRQPMALLLTDREAGESGPGPSRYFVRIGEEIRPLEVAGIVSIAGADDYAEVVTILGRHLVRMTLAEFEKSLDPVKFIRVHRSRIVNVERIVRAEPAGGGRLLLHMEDGEAINASRAGSRLLRDRVL